MSLEHNKHIVRRQFEDLINRRDLSILDADMAADFVDHEAPPGSPSGIAGARQWIETLHASVPDLHVTIEDILAEGDKVMVRNVWRGTHSHRLFGMAPTGKSFTLKGIVVWRIADGQLKERWATLDHWGLRQQLQPSG